MKTVAERGIVRRERGQNSGVINRFPELGFQLPNPLNNAGVHERAEILKSIRLVEQGAKLPQLLHIGIRERWRFGLRQYLEQCNFKWRKRNRSIETIATLLPLPGHARMAKQERCDQICLVTVGAGVVAVPRKIAQ